jgi:cobalamin biosynthesis protein CobT
MMKQYLVNAKCYAKRLGDEWDPDPEDEDEAGEDDKDKDGAGEDNEGEDGAGEDNEDANEASEEDEDEASEDEDVQHHHKGSAPKGKKKSTTKLTKVGAGSYILLSNHYACYRRQFRRRSPSLQQDPLKTRMRTP